MDSAAYFDKAVSYKRKIFMKSFPEWVTNKKVL
jgi:hypothetical protein